MSIDETQQLDKDEIDLVELFRSIWFHKFSLLVILILSVPVSLMYTSTLAPKYRAETVFEKPSDNRTQGSSSLLSNIEGLGLLNFLGGASAVGSSDSFYSEIRSESFLKTVILNNANFDSLGLKKFCPLPSKDTSRFSLRSILISLGISENRAPSESQKTSLLVQCVNEMLEIDFDSYGSNESSAYRLSVVSEDPNFSANLANQIVEKYFVLHEKKRDQEFQNVKEYLSKVITEAQLEFITANKLIQSFKIKHSLLMNIKPSSDFGTSSTSFGSEMSIPASPFAPEMNKKIAHLSQLEKTLNQLKKASLNLSNLKELNRAKIKTFISSTEAQGVFSRAFITAISKISNLSADTSVTNQEITKIVSQELMSLKQQIQGLEEKIGEREEQTIKLMTIENRFQELAIDVAKKQLIFEGLKDQLKEKILTAGLANVEQPSLLTKAVPPFSKASPNKKLIVVLGVILSIFLGIAYIAIRQVSLRRVHSLSQLQRISGFLSCYLIKYKRLKQMGERSDKTVIGQSFFSHARGMDKLGCIIDLSQKREIGTLASEFSETIANLLAADNSKIACLDASPSKKPFSASKQKSFEPDHGNLNLKGISGKNILCFNDEDGMIAAGEVNKIKSKYSDYDKIICALGTKVGDLTKFKFIEQCDFYILIGRSFGFDEQTYRKFSNTVWEKEKKCLGFFLID